MNIDRNENLFADILTPDEDRKTFLKILYKRIPEIDFYIFCLEENKFHSGDNPVFCPQDQLAVLLDHDFNGAPSVNIPLNAYDLLCAFKINKINGILIYKCASDFDQRLVDLCFEVFNLKMKLDHELELSEVRRRQMRRKLNVLKEKNADIIMENYKAYCSLSEKIEAQTD